MLRAVIWCAVSTKEQTKEDKFSLKEQEADALALCEREGWRVVDVLRVPGHSRYYSDIHELAADARSNGIDAFDKMLEHWQRCDFDVLICKDGDRFARRQSLHAYFTERTLDSRAQIYSFSDGWIDEEKAEMWMAMNGYKAAAHVKRLVKERAKGMKARMDRGLNGGNTIPECYRIARDERGKATHLEFREQYRQMMDDAATLLLEGVGWKRFSVVMAERFGHINPKTGQPYHDNTFFRLFHSPICWGATALRYVNKNGLWAFDENAPRPEGLEINYHPNPPIPAIWTGITAELVKAELRRRANVVHGRGKPDSEYRFTGLLICGECQRRMAIDMKLKWNGVDYYLYWRCSSHTYRHYKIKGLCSNRRVLRDETVQEQINSFLSRYLAQNNVDLTPFIRPDSESARRQTAADQLNNQVAALRTKLDRLIFDQSEAPENTHDSYARRIQRVSEELESKTGELRRIQATVEAPAVAQTRTIAYEKLQKMGLDNFWQRPAHEINQILHLIMGSHRFVARDGEIVDIL